jgi:hypothetical protein
MNKKKWILVVGGVITVITITIVILALKTSIQEENEIVKPDFLLEPSIEQGEDLTILEMGDIPRLSSSSAIYYAEDITNVSAVENLIDNLGFSYKRNKAIVDNHFSWGDEDSTAYFNYFTETNILSLNIKKSIKAVLPLTRDNAEEIVNRYLNGIGLDHEYKMIKIENEEDCTHIYLSRILGGYPVETNNQYGATDYLMFSDRGELIYAELLFAKFTNQFNYNIPLIDTKDLLSLINEPEYPKEIRVDDVDFLDDTVLKPVGAYQMEGEYSDATSTVIESVQDCNPTDISLVYYYPEATGVYILPTYKLTCLSTAIYEGTEYSVPAIVYTNAVSPEYISAE